MVLADLALSQSPIVPRRPRSLRPLPGIGPRKGILGSDSERNTPVLVPHPRQAQSAGRAPDPNDGSASRLSCCSRGLFPTFPHVPEWLGLPE